MGEGVKGSYLTPLPPHPVIFSFNLISSMLTVKNKNHTKKPSGYNLKLDLPTADQIIQPNK